MRMATLCQVLIAAFVALTVIEGAFIKDYLAMFMGGVCTVVFTAALMILSELEEIKESLG